MARSGFELRDPRSLLNAGPVGGPLLPGDGKGPWGVLPPPRGPLGALDISVCIGGAFGLLPPKFACKRLGCMPGGFALVAAGPEGALAGGGWDGVSRRSPVGISRNV